MRSVIQGLLVVGLAAGPAMADRPDNGGAKPSSRAVERRSGAAADRREKSHASSSRNGSSRSSSSADRSHERNRDRSSGSGYRDNGHNRDRSSSWSADRYRDNGRNRESARTLTEAQRRHPRAGTGTGYDRDRNRSYGRYGGRSYGGWGFGFYDNNWSVFYNPYGYGNRWGYGYYPYSYSGSRYYSPYYYGSSYSSSRYRRYDRDGAGSMRIIVEPERTRVYVDGYYAGIVDDFDGLLQRLHVAPGRHEIALKLDGYRTQVFRVYVPYDQTIRLEHDMVRGDGEDRNEEMATAPRGYDEYDDDRGRDDRRGDDRRADVSRGDAGTLRLDVSPSNAAVYVDDQFRGTAGELTRLRLPAGRHRVEIVRPGYRTMTREVDVRSGDETELELELDRS